jgi:UDP-GlcNAc:undecaprenyl-phosphate GlcNAc-1-phosphate transferase
VSLRHYLALIAIALVTTALLTPLVRALGQRLGLVDQPGGRRVHRDPVSRIGGVALLGGFGAAIAAQAVGEAYLGWGGSLLDRDTDLVAVLAGILIVFVVGLLDDIIDLSAWQKLLGQLLGAGVVIAFGPRVDFIGNPFGGGLVFLGIIAIPATLLWILGFTNIINLIDGLDGLAAGVTAIAAVSFLVIAVESNQLAAAALAAALIGACVGFLFFNFNPASVFMGDSGALFLGFALASISLLGVMKSVAAIALAVPLIVIGVPIFDTASAIVRRLRHGRPVHEADAGHIHHRLLGRGFDQRQTVLMIYGWSAALAFGGYAMRWVPLFVKLAAFLVMAVLSGFMAYWLGLFEAAHEATHHHAEE